MTAKAFAVRGDKVIQEPEQISYKALPLWPSWKLREHHRDKKTDMIREASSWVYVHDMSCVFVICISSDLQTREKGFDLY